MQNDILITEILSPKQMAELIDIFNRRSRPKNKEE